MRALPFSLLIACAAGACAVPTDNPTEASPDAPPPPAATDTARAIASPANPDAISYGCDDNRVVHVGYGEDDATLQMDGQSTVTLPRAESASTPGVDVYVGRDVALQRESDSIQLELAGASLRCWPAQAPR